MMVQSMALRRSASSTASASASLICGGVLVLERELRAGLEPGERRAQVVRDVVEGIAHGADERLVALEHPVEEGDEFVDFVLGARIGHAGVQVAGLDDGADRADDCRGSGRARDR